LIRRAAALESDNLYFPREEFCKEAVSVRSSMRYDSGKLLLAVDIAGTFLLGVEGADAAIRGNLDLLGFFSRARSSRPASGYLCDGRAGGRRDFDCHPQGLVFRRHLRPLLLCSPKSLPVISTGISRASRIRSHLEHGENLERS